MRTFPVLLLCLLLAACSTTTVRMYGNQSTSGGTTVTTTSSQVSGSAQGSNFRVSFSSGGRPVSPTAPGGHVYASGSAAYVVIGVVVLADLWNYFLGAPQAKPLAPGTRIADTCSCYKKEGGEAEVTK
ncbi:MAG TPA: hypothetical protein VLA81_09395 [Burkholderiales bacterium]|nr:hypothetical protein [Burkholderiales bacterium]